jgi:hypothetical protein
MKRQITLSIVLTVGVLLSLAFFYPTTQGQEQQKTRVTVADTGILTLNENQMLRVTVTGDWDGNGDVSGAELFFRRLEYAQVSRSGGASKTALSSKTTSDSITLAPGEDVSFDIPNTAFGVRGVVMSNRPDVRVTAQIINRTTGGVEAFSGFDGSGNTFLTQAKTPGPVTVVRRINRSMLTAEMIQTIRSTPFLNAAVAIQGNTIRAREGNSLWLLSNRGFALVIGGETLETEPLASEIWTKDMGNGDLYVAACFCPGGTANPNDGCEFDGLPREQNCKGPTCCDFKDGVILGTGTPILF